MSAAFQGASNRDFEDSATWLANTIKWYLSPKSAVRFLRRVVEIIENQPDYEESQDMCGGFCAYSTCDLVCARASDSRRHCRCFQHQVENMCKRRWNHEQGTWASGSKKMGTLTIFPANICNYKIPLACFACPVCSSVKDQASNTYAYHPLFRLSGRAMGKSNLLNQLLRVRAI